MPVIAVIDGKGHFGRPGVAPELICGRGIILDVDGGLLGFEKEFSGAADPETIIGGFGHAADLDGILVDDILVGFGVALDVVHVPAETFEERINL